MTDADSTSPPERTWGPYPGDSLVPPPTPPAPEIPMSPTWPWVAAAGVALRVVVPIMAVMIVAVIVVGLIAHWW